MDSLLRQRKRTNIILNNLYNTCIYSKIYCGYLCGACIVAAEVLVKAMEVPVVAVTVADGEAATVCDNGCNGATVEEGGATETTGANCGAAERAWSN